MFTTKRRKNYITFIYSAIIVVLCLLIVAIAWPSGQAEPVNAAEKTEQPNAASPTSPTSPSGEQADSEEPISDEKNNITDREATYYLVKSVDGQIKVFFIDGNDEPLELETTQIVYELLSTADQKLFDEGFRVEGQEELAVLLQDFES